MAPAIDTLIWNVGDDLARLDQCLELLNALEEVQVEERRAVANMDPGALAALTEREQHIADQLAELIAACEKREGEPIQRSQDTAVVRLRRQVRKAAQRVAIQAQTNAALLTDAADAIAETFGLKRDAGTYDRRARRNQQLRTVTGRAA